MRQRLISALQRQRDKTVNQRLLLVLLCILLSACSGHDKVKNDLQALAERLESFTDLAIEQTNSSQLLNAPAKHSLEYPIPGIQIAFREFYAIDDCPLGQFIAERNTALGKTQLPSIRFAYEARLLQTLDDCLVQLEQNNEMNKQLQTWIAQKQENLPLVWANMLTQSNESYLAFTTAGDYIAGNSEDGLQATKLALRYLLDAANDEAIDAGELELHLKALSNARLPARMWRTQKLFSAELSPISDMLRRYIEQSKNNCGSTQQKEELKIMRNIFTMFFADAIQPLASQLNHYQYQLNPSFDVLSSHPDLPPVWKAYIREHYIDDAMRYKSTMQEHIELWQDIFKLCE